MPELPPVPDGPAPPRPWPPRSWAERVDELRSRLPVSLLGWVIAVGAVACVLGLGWWFLRPPPAPVEQSLPMAARHSSLSASGGTSPRAPDAPPGNRAPTDASATTVSGLVVHAAGAVIRPGVYRLAQGARVADMVAAAGGLAPDADSNRINLAAPVQDGERVYLPHQNEVAVPPAEGDPPGGSTTALSPSALPGSPGARGAALPGQLIDLNTATADQLDSLPGVGPSTAAAVLDYRRQHGRFQAVDELLDVRGIGDAKLAQLRDRVRV